MGGAGGAPGVTGKQRRPPGSLGIASTPTRCDPMQFGRVSLVRLFGVVNRGFARRSQRRDMLERWRWNGGTTSLNLGVIWEMSDKSYKS